MPKGLGLLIWQLRSLPEIDGMIATLRSIGVSWVSFKIRDGIYASNQVDVRGNYTGKSDYLEYVIAKFKAAGIEVGGWAFLYTGSNMAQQAKLASDDVSKYGLSHLLIDAEAIPSLGALWKDPRAGTWAVQYMDGLKTPKGFPVGLCTYRFPVLHREFPFNAFLKHPKNTLNAPQMYWIGAHNPAEQLARSYTENQAIRALPFVPIGAAFREAGWEPTAAEIKTFVSASRAMGLEGYGFWSLDQAIKRPDWLLAMKAPGTPVPQPPDPAPEDPEDIPVKIFHVKSKDGLRCRSAIIPSVKYGRVPGKTYGSSTIYFVLPYNSPVEVLEVIEDGKNLWARVGQRQYCAIRYDDVTYLA